MHLYSPPSFCGSSFGTCSTQELSSQKKVWFLQIPGTLVFRNYTHGFTEMVLEPPMPIGSMGLVYLPTFG